MQSQTPNEPDSPATARTPQTHGGDSVASAQRKRRILAVAALAVAAGTLALLAFGGLGENLVYYWSPSELMADPDKARGATIRLGGLVSEGSIRRGADGLTLDFEVTDGDSVVPVHAEAVPPAMFREGIGVVLEGRLLDNGTFETKRLMVKHDNEYRAPDYEDEKSMDELIKTMQFEQTDT